MGKALLAGLADTAVRQIFHGQRLTARTTNTIDSMAALLRELNEVRERGYALDNEELELGLRCVAAPIRDAEGAVVASLGLSGPAPRLTDDAVREVSAHVVAAARLASLANGGPPDGRAGAAKDASVST